MRHKKNDQTAVDKECYGCKRDIQTGETYFVDKDGDYFCCTCGPQYRLGGHAMEEKP